MNQVTAKRFCFGITRRQQARAISKSVRMSPKKVRRVLNQIKGRPYKEAIVLLKYMPYKACKPVWKVLYSAVSNAKNNLGLDKQDLFVKIATVSQGRTYKGFRSRAQGRIYKILKASCHIHIVVETN
jgi:large subunit ribosomal protein L22|uniref:ribosomal protein L22 n=1 Tax=Fibrocapsa japonica TaxID=94617 RepID=UPI002115B01D|nr:ribosomal protein L22 [Fibrocapsa japonica]UTE95154.1 ribosomal protein L22 [Fibrocapsa japonica]